MDAYVDAHAHWSSAKLSEAELSTWRAEARARKIAGVIFGGVDPAEWERQRSLHARHPSFFRMTFGVHPWTASHLTSEGLRDALESLASQVSAKPSGLVGIGELGLDYGERFDADARVRQHFAFRTQLNLLLRLRQEGSPLAGVFHVVHAHEDFQLGLRECLGAMPPAGGAWGILHSFSGTLADAHFYQRWGLIPSVSLGVLGRKKGKSFEVLKRTVLDLTLGDFVLETDAPDQPPAGEAQNHPGNLITLATWIAEWRGSRETPEEILAASTARLREIFRWPEVNETQE